MLQKIAFKFLLACIVIAAFLHSFGEPLLQLLLPLFKWQIQAMDDQYKLLSLSIKSLGTDRVFSMQVILAKPLILGGQFILPDPRGVATASSIIAHVWQMLVIFLAVLVALPVKQFTEYFRRIAFALPVLIVVLMLDIPFSLLATLKALILEQLKVDGFSALLFWNDILEGGGRLVLGLVGGLVSDWLANSLKINN
ncbi:MAG: hypothetical protein ACKVOA_06105 [Methylophilaceae bacterium]